MLKFIIISVLFIYVVYKASDFILRMVDSVTGGGRVKNNQRNRNFGPEYRRQQQQSRRPEGDINIDYVPKDQKQKAQRSSEDYQGGEYVDYEELK